MLSLSSYQFEIRVDGRPLEIYLHNSRYFVVGEPGKAYSLYVRNAAYNTRIEVLESVDGRNVLKDEPARLSNSGMVIQREWENEGYLINSKTVRKFVFGNAGSSIAAQVGDIAHIGVIGLAIFKEKAMRIWDGTLPSSNNVTLDLVRQAKASYTMTSFAPADLGTHMGDEVPVNIGRTDFDRASSTPDVMLEVQYRTEQWLRDAGVLGPRYPAAWHDDETGYGKYAR